jgi:hypothetical protein
LVIAPKKIINTNAIGRLKVKESKLKDPLRKKK